MGKLTDMVVEDLSLAEKVKINLRKVGLAGVGLASIVDSERTRLYRQIMDMGEPLGGSDTVVGRISLLGTGTINLLVEESLRVFDELVEEGEQALNRTDPPALAAAKPAPARIVQSRPVAKTRAPASQALKSVPKQPAKSQQQKVAARKPVKAAEKQSPVSLSPELTARLARACEQAAGLSLDDQQQLEVNALTLQVQQGDVSGRRPAKSKPQAMAEFDARRQLKGMKAEAALSRLEALIKRLTPETVA
ncbi:MAG: hypothetical protein GY938_08130 [Ketobacter sp.]|nr:hypothetical protein [Ketobacter sp.]